MEDAIDVVIPTKGEWTLPYCLKAIKQSIPKHRVILVSTEDFAPEATKLADVAIICPEKNVGKARAMGLELVESDVYASIDSDVQVTPEWWRWCIKAIEPSDVAACQGYALHQAPLYEPIRQKWIFEKGGQFGKGFACLGNTLLKTRIIRKIGMPPIKVGEDWDLRLKVEAAGYKWLTNFNIKTNHLKNDVDIWKHAVWWARMGGNTNPLRCIVRIPYYLTFGLQQRSLAQNLFLVSLQIHFLFGIATKPKMR